MHINWRPWQNKLDYRLTGRNSADKYWTNTFWTLSFIKSNWLCYLRTCCINQKFYVMCMYCKKKPRTKTELKSTLWWFRSTRPCYSEENWETKFSVCSMIFTLFVGFIYVFYYPKVISLNNTFGLVVQICSSFCLKSCTAQQLYDQDDSCFICSAALFALRTCVVWRKWNPFDFLSYFWCFLVLSFLSAFQVNVWWY